MAHRIDATLTRQRFDRVAGYQANQEERYQRHADEGRHDQAETG